MALQSIWEFLCGHVKVVVKGKTIEKFINMATSRGIMLWDIVWKDKDAVIVSVRVSGIRPIAFLCKQLGCQLKIVSKRGLPFYLWRVQQRKALAGGAVVFVLLLYLLSAFVWSIQVTREGPVTIDNKQLLASAYKVGLRQGVLKSKLDFKAIEQQIAEDFPNISFVDVHTKGTRIIVSVVEKTLKPEDEHNKLPAHVVAKKQGLITQVLVTQGQGMVKEGDVVQPGQILISGEMLPVVEEVPPTPDADQPEAEVEPEDPIRYVPARGLVKARVWYKGYGEIQLLNREYQKTGRSAVRVSMKLANREIILKGPKKLEYKEFVQTWRSRKIKLWRNWVIPVEVVTTNIYETKAITQKLTYAHAKGLAQKRAEAEIQACLPKGVQVVDKKVTEISTNNSLVQLEVNWEVIEEIGRIQLMRR